MELFHFLSAHFRWLICARWPYHSFAAQSRARLLINARCFSTMQVKLLISAKIIYNLQRDLLLTFPKHKSLFIIVSQLAIINATMFPLKNTKVFNCFFYTFEFYLLDSHSKKLILKPSGSQMWRKKLILVRTNRLSWLYLVCWLTVIYRHRKKK